MDFIPQYIENKHNPENIQYSTPLLKPILDDTYGQIVYQEQVMQIVQNLGGFSMSRADLVRKAMGDCPVKGHKDYPLCIEIYA